MSSGILFSQRGAFDLQHSPTSCGLLSLNIHSIDTNVGIVIGSILVRQDQCFRLIFSSRFINLLNHE